MDREVALTCAIHGDVNASSRGGVLPPLLATESYRTCACLVLNQMDWTCLHGDLRACSETQINLLNLIKVSKIR
jgi:hypothetical protein